MARLLDFDPIKKIRRMFHFSEGTGEAVIETRHDVTDLVEANKAQFNRIDERAGWKGDMHRVASIPMPVYWELVKKGIANDEQALRKWLDDPDNQLFRCRPGKLSR